MSNTVYFFEPKIINYAEKNSIPLINISSDRTLVLLPTDATNDFSESFTPSKPSYVSESFSSWPVLSPTESKQLLSYEASDFGSSDGYKKSIRKTPKSPVQEIFFDGPSHYDDYLQWRWAIKDLLPATWTEMTEFEKAISIELNLAPLEGNNKVIWQMSKGMSQSCALDRIYGFFAYNHKRNIESCKNRAEHERVAIIIAKYLGETQGIQFTRTIESLLIQYKEHVVIGTEHGSGGQVGLIDFFNNTSGTVYETAGLANQGYVMQNGDPDTTNFSAELVNWFINRL